jgi:hypothetical protein
MHIAGFMVGLNKIVLFFTSKVHSPDRWHLYFLSVLGIFFEVLSTEKPVGHHVKNPAKPSTAQHFNNPSPGLATIKTGKEGLCRGCRRSTFVQEIRKSKMLQLLFHL